MSLPFNLVPLLTNEWYPRNLDPNSGNPVGISIFPASYFDGKRTTSANAHLPYAPNNLIVWTDSPVVQVLFSGKRAVGIELENGNQGKFLSQPLSHHCN
jgi:hypothetical protein